MEFRNSRIGQDVDQELGIGIDRLDSATIHGRTLGQIKHMRPSDIVSLAHAPFIEGCGRRIRKEAIRLTGGLESQRLQVGSVGGAVKGLASENTYRLLGRGRRGDLRCQIVRGTDLLSMPLAAGTPINAPRLTCTPLVDVRIKIKLSSVQGDTFAAPPVPNTNLACAKLMASGEAL